MPDGLAQRLRPHAWPAAVGLGLGLLALGPALGRGFILSYDMVFVPDPPITTADLGVTGGPARAVPSDLVVALVAKIIPAQIFQKVILLALFVAACSGAAALLAANWQPRLPLLARLVAGVFYAWNPFVAERLIMGQWALLLGYAGLPWVLRELSWRDGHVRPLRLAIAVLPAFVGGFAAMSITTLAALPVAAVGGADRQSRVRRILIAAGTLAVASLPWVIPSLTVPVHADPAGATAFAARADTPFGTVGSLLMLSGIWNAQAVPAGYGGIASVCWLLVAAAAIACYIVVARPRRLVAGLGVAAAIGFCLSALGSWAPTLAALRDAISAWSGFALLRDGQQFIAPLALAEAIGLGAGVAALIAIGEAMSRRADPASAKQPATPDKAARGGAVTIGTLAMIASVVLLPGLAWGAVGRLQAVNYPADWLAARQFLDRSTEPGTVLLLPWAQYRAYPWNNGETVFDPWPRLLARPMIWNDALQVGRVTVAAESQSARRLGPLVESGRPLTAAMEAAGIRFVIVDAGPILDRPRARLAMLARLPGARVLLASRDLILFRLPGR
jgi:hypothetical protein